MTLDEIIQKITEAENSISIEREKKTASILLSTILNAHRLF